MADADVLVIEAEPDDVELVVGSPTSTEPSFTVEDVQGLKGDPGDPGPAGADSVRGPALLTGDRAPLSTGSGLDPLDGVNDPWRWMPSVSGWVGPAYQLTLAGSEVIPAAAIPNPEGQNLANGPAVYLAAIVADTVRDFSTSPALFTLYQADGSNNGQGTPTLYWSPSDPANPAQDTEFHAAGAVSGIAFLVQYELNFAGPTAVPYPDQDTVAVLTGLGLTVGALYTFVETPGDGQDGDFWVDKATMDLYGPKAGGVWPAPVNVRGLDTNDYHRFTNQQMFGPSNYPGTPAFVVAADREPEPGSFDTSSVVLWYEDTEGAPVVHFKAKDAAGAVYVASLPMTPA